MFLIVLCGTIIKPKLGLKTVDHARVAYEAWAAWLRHCEG